MYYARSGSRMEEVEMLEPRAEPALPSRTLTVKEN